MLRKLPVGRTIGVYVAVAALSVLLLLMLFPFILVVINSFKTPSEYAAGGPLALPAGLYLKGLIDFWHRVDFTNKLFNSALISLSVAVLGVILSLLNGFALGIGRVRGRVALVIIFIMANTLPQEALAYPLFYFAKAANLYNTQLAVILIFMVIQGAFGTYLLTSVFSAFPTEMLEAALVDGCSKSRLLFRIVAPVTMPTISVLFTFFFIWTWNEFFLPLIMLVSDSRQTVPIAISTLQGQHSMDVTTTSASALLGILPAVLFFALFQRTLTKGITAGSIK